MDHNLTLTSTETIGVAPEKVWHALTDKEMIKQYFFGTNVETDWQPGSAIIFTGEWEGQSYRVKGTILEHQPGKLLKYNYWSGMGGLEDKPENYAIITYALKPVPEGTQITITQQGFRDRKAYDDSVTGWQTVLSGLKSLLEK